MASRKDCDKAIYSDSVVLRDIEGCSLDTHSIGQAPYVITKPVRDFAVLGSSCAVSGFQFPAKSASANTSNDLLSVGSMIIPPYAVP